MPKRNDIKKVMIIGSGPIVIGQACEFDYSGTQACKALRALGYEIVLVNSNPATIMTDPGMADATYIEPLNLQRMTEIIEKERPDALLPNLGGQTGLNLSSELHKAGVLDQYGVRIIGVQADAIQRGEDRLAFKETMKKLGIDLPKSELAYNVEEAEKIAAGLGYPVVIRPAYTMGGTGGGLVFNVEELRLIAARGIAASLIGQILVEESVLGWEELELEVVRDSKNKLITVCFIENIDAMGVHTGDSFCAAPMLTIDEKLQKKLQKWSYDVVEAIQVIGGTNIQFAHDPKTGRVVIIEINPRTSRSSALASKATGFPIAQVSAMLAGGLTLDEIRTGATARWIGVPHQIEMEQNRLRCLRSALTAPLPKGSAPIAQKSSLPLSPGGLISSGIVPNISPVDAIFAAASAPRVRAIISLSADIIWLCGAEDEISGMHRYSGKSKASLQLKTPSSMPFQPDSMSTALANSSSFKPRLSTGRRFMRYFMISGVWKLPISA